MSVILCYGVFGVDVVYPRCIVSVGISGVAAELWPLERAASGSVVQPANSVGWPCVRALLSGWLITV